MRDKLAFYDVECFPNFFMISFRMRTPDGTRDEIFKIQDWESGLEYFSNKDYWYVGFNTASYDDLMIAYWLTLGKEATHELLYDMNQYLIDDDHTAHPTTTTFIEANVSEFTFSKFGQTRTNRSLIPKRSAWALFGGWDRKTIDLYMLGEKSGSLKNAATVLGVDSLMESPIEFGTVLDEAGKADIVKYCWKDIEITEKAYDYYEEIILVRDEFASKYGISNAHNVGSAKLAEKYLINMHKSRCDESTFSQWQSDNDTYLEQASENKAGDKVLKLTKDYKHEFKDRGMQKLWDMLKRSYLSYRPNVGKDIDVYIDEVVDFEDWKKKSKEPSSYYIDGQAIPKGMLLFDDDRGNTYKFGIGGLHNDAPKGRWVSNDEMVIWNVDVTSYYPSLISANDYSPECFPEFSTYIAELLKDRREAKAAGNKIESDAKKLVLNSSFGKTKDKHSKLYDPLAHFSVTINGQLLLLRLIDFVHQASPSAKLLNANTDGVCFYLPRKDLIAVRAMCEAWESLSRVELEEDLFDVWYQTSCNNYCAKMDNGSIKSKGGDFKLKPSALKETFAKSPALKKALVNYVLKDVKIEDTLASLSVTDFCMTMNFGKKTQLVIGDNVVPKKVLRYVYANNGEKFRKYTPSTDRYSIVGAGRDLMMVDVLSDITMNDIDIPTYALDVKEMIIDTMLDRKSKCLPKKIKDNIAEVFAQWEIDNGTNV